MPPNNEPTKLADFNFSLPDELIAQEPLAKRDASRLITRDTKGKVSHSHIADLAEQLRPNSLILMNDTKVLPGRILGHLATGGKVEILLLEKKEQPGRWSALAKPMRKLKPGTTINMEEGLQAEIISKPEASSEGSTPITVALSKTGKDLEDWLYKYGYVPLPPYIERKTPKTARDSDDYERYQTVYANKVGSAAAPTAGLHFSSELLEALRLAGHEIAFVNLHVGAGTFLPVKAESIAEHVMHKEVYCVPEQTLNKVLSALRDKREIIAVGTTTLRCLESFHKYCAGGEAEMRLSCDKNLETNLFVYPKVKNDLYKPWAINALLTNFHQPCSTLFMLVCALVGTDAMKDLYSQAIAGKYRFFSYGDACLLQIP